jgi:hypothetical protein
VGIFVCIKRRVSGKTQSRNYAERKLNTMTTIDFERKYFCAESLRKTLIRTKDWRISRNQVRPVVEIEDVEWGYAIVRRSIVTIDEGVRKHMSGSAFEAICKKLFEYIKAAGPKGIAKSGLMRKPGVNAAGQMFDQATRYLASSEKIKETPGHGGIKYVSLRT